MGGEAIQNQNQNHGCWMATGCVLFLQYSTVRVPSSTGLEGPGVGSPPADLLLGGRGVLP